MGNRGRTIAISKQPETQVHFDRLLNLGWIKFMAWSNCRSAESLAMIVYQFSVSSLEIWLLGLDFYIFLRSLQRFHTRIWCWMYRERDSDTLGYRKGDFFISPLCRACRLKATHIAVEEQEICVLQNSFSLNLIEPNYGPHLQMMLIICPATMVSAFLERKNRHLFWAHVMAEVFEGKEERGAKFQPKCLSLQQCFTAKNWNNNLSQLLWNSI